MPTIHAGTHVLRSAAWSILKLSELGRLSRKRILPLPHCRASATIHAGVARLVISWESLPLGHRESLLLKSAFWSFPVQRRFMVVSSRLAMTSSWFLVTSSSISGKSWVSFINLWSEEPYFFWQLAGYSTQIHALKGLRHSEQNTHTHTHTHTHNVFQHWNHLAVDDLVLVCVILQAWTPCSTISSSLQGSKSTPTSESFMSGVENTGLHADSTPLFDQPWCLAAVNWPEPNGAGSTGSRRRFAGPSYDCSAAGIAWPT